MELDIILEEDDRHRPSPEDDIDDYHSSRTPMMHSRGTAGREAAESGVIPETNAMHRRMALNIAKRIITTSNSNLVVCVGTAE